jgi:phosphatidylglycerol:prolipoprotein diacylglycerol transferase
MYPYIHIGTFAIGTFGLLLWLAAVVGCWSLHRNFRRYQIDADAIGIVAFITIAGVVGAKLWHVLEEPRLLVHDPAGMLLDRAGFAWFGGLLGGIFAMVVQARGARLRGLSMLDLCSPAAAFGYGVGRIGCLVSGDGDYGVPTTLPWGMSFPHGLVPTTQRVHPTPIYEFLVALLIGWFLWRQSAPARGRLLHRGVITGEYLVLSGVARFLVEFIRINPPFLGRFTNAQVASFGTVVVGAALWLWARRRAAEPLLLPVIAPVEAAAH